MLRLLSFALSLVCSLGVSAQVGVNQPSPQQTLDVNGKIRVGDDTTAPDAGTIRFNPTTSSFEGFDGTEWKNLSQEKSGGLPSGPVPILGTVIVNPTGSHAVTFRRWDTRQSFSQVPSNRYVIITSINVIPNAVIVDETREYYVKVNPSSTNSGFGSGTYGFLMTGKLGGSRQTIAGQSPLIILRPGEYARAFQSDFVGNATNLNLEIRGFLVDDLDY